LSISQKKFSIQSKSLYAVGVPHNIQNCIYLMITFGWIDFKIAGAYIVLSEVLALPLSLSLEIVKCVFNIR
jgi:hypothetical protein